MRRSLRFRFGMWLLCVRVWRFPFGWVAGLGLWLTRFYE